MRCLFYCVMLIGAVCSAQKAEYAIVNDFIEAELRGLTYDSIHVQKEPVNIIVALNLYELAYNERMEQNASLARVWIKPELKEWPFDKKEIESLKKGSVKITDDWEGRDFSNKRFVFKNKAIIDDIRFRKSYLDKGTNEYVLRLSRPIYTKNKTYALFNFDFRGLLLGGGATSNIGTIIMKKENGKWIVLSNIREAVYD